MAEDALHVDAGGQGLVAVRHDGAGEGAEPGAIEIEEDEQDGGEADGRTDQPGLGQRRAEKRQRADAEEAAGQGALVGAEGQGGAGLDHLRQAEEQDDRQHLRIARSLQAGDDEGVDREAQQEEGGGNDEGCGQGMQAGGGEQGGGGERAEHEDVAVGEVDDPHDAEHQVQAEADQREIQAEDEA